MVKFAQCISLCAQPCMVLSCQAQLCVRASTTHSQKVCFAPPPSNLMLLQNILPHQDQTQEVVNIYVGGKMATLSIGFFQTTIAAMYATCTSLSSASALSRYCSSTPEMHLVQDILLSQKCTYLEQNTQK